LTEQDKKTNERAVKAEHELAAFIKENRHKAAPQSKLKANTATT